MNRPKSVEFGSRERRGVRAKLFAKQEGICYWCKMPMTLEVAPNKGQPFWNYATFEHLDSRQKGGTDDPENLVLAHYACNHARHAGEREELKKRGQMQLAELTLKKDIL